MLPFESTRTETVGQLIRWDSHRHSADAGNPDWINPTGLDIKFLYPLARGASIFEKVTAPPPKVTGPNIVKENMLLPRCPSL